MDAVGDRWSLLILREAFYGTHRFDDFQYFLGVAPNILLARLKKLVQAGVMKRVKAEGASRPFRLRADSRCAQRPKRSQSWVSLHSRERHSRLLACGMD
jgi:DNA-binding Lrp family transcriptional regulator